MACNRPLRLFSIFFKRIFFHTCAFHIIQLYSQIIFNNYNSNKNSAPHKRQYLSVLQYLSKKCLHIGFLCLISVLKPGDFLVFDDIFLEKSDSFLLKKIIFGFWISNNSISGKNTTPFIGNTKILIVISWEGNWLSGDLKYPDVIPGNFSFI